MTLTDTIEQINHLTRQHADNEETSFCVAIPIEYLRALDKQWERRNISPLLTDEEVAVLKDEVSKVVDSIAKIAEENNLLRRAVEPIVNLTKLLDANTGGIFGELPDDYDIFSSDFTSGLQLSVLRNITSAYERTGEVQRKTIPASQMSLRDWFAGSALAEVPDPINASDAPQTARLAYAIADAMIEHRSSGKTAPTEVAISNQKQKEQQRLLYILRGVLFYLSDYRRIMSDASDYKALLRTVKDFYIENGGDSGYTDRVAHTAQGLPGSEKTDTSVTEQSDKSGVKRP